ncbi:MAG: ATP-binding protein [Prevotella sp.]|nr:ATP-binding protein [Prevotella sp.]
MTFIAMYLLSLLVACSDKRVTGVSKGNDSTLTADYISKISLQEPDRALALIDTMEMNNEERPYAINYMRFVVYNNGLADYKMADYYGKQVLKDSIELKQDCKRYYSLLNTLASIANSNNQFAQSIIYAKKAAEIARDNNMKEYEVGAIGTVALSTIMLGDKDSGFKMFSNNKDMVMKVMSDNPDFATADMAYSFMGNYVESLIADKKYDEVEKNIPDLLYITNKLKTIDNIMDGYAEYRQLHTYSILMNYYDAKGNKKESEKCLNEIMKSDLVSTSFVQAMISEHYFNVKDIKKLAEITAKMRKDITESEDTISEFFINYVLEYEKFINKKFGNYRVALEKSEMINDVKDSLFKKYTIEDGVRLSKIYETQEKEYLLQVKDAQLSKHKNIFIVVTVMMILGTAFIVLLLLFNRKVNRRNKTIVSTINQMMQREGELTKFRLSEDANNINPDKMRLMQSLEMLKGNKTLDEIATACGFGNAKAFNKKFHEHFGIQAEEYRKWSKNMSKQDKTNIEEAKQMKDSFIRNMSHEIRTPLNQIFGFVQLLTDPNIQLSDEEKRQYNDIISDQTTYMTRLINKFLELSEYESSDEPLPRETISIDETLSIVQSTVPQPQAGVELTFSNNSGKDTIDTNGKGLTRILQCLVGNAVKFTPSGYISVECITNAEGSVTFSVTDTGKGIPEGDEERIFDRFYKVDSFVPGAGLGLSLVREIAKRMDATVNLDRTYTSQGSMFTVTLRENTHISKNQNIKDKTL